MQSRTREYLQSAGLSGAAYLYENHASIAPLNFAELSICALVAQCEKTGLLRPEQLAFIASKLEAALAERNPLPTIARAPTPPAPTPPQDNGNGGAMVPRPTPPKSRPPSGVKMPAPALAW